jgi:hypothetical protein
MTTVKEQIASDRGLDSDYRSLAVNPSPALKNAINCFQLAEEAKDEPSRKRYLKLAEGWLDQAAVEDWLKGNVSPTSISVLNE